MSGAPNGDFRFGYFFARRSAKPWKGRERTRPKMPSGPWRAAAISCMALGVLVAWLLFRASDSAGWRMFAGGVIGLIAGMYVVETIWERRVSARERQGPIGPRR